MAKGKLGQGYRQNRNRLQVAVTKSIRLSEVKIKEGVFIGPKIRWLLRNSQFDQALFRKGENRAGSISVDDDKISREKTANNFTEFMSKPHKNK